MKISINAGTRLNMIQLAAHKKARTIKHAYHGSKLSSFIRNLLIKLETRGILRFYSSYWKVCLGFKIIRCCKKLLSAKRQDI